MIRQNEFVRMRCNASARWGLSASSTDIVTVCHTILWCAWTTIVLQCRSVHSTFAQAPEVPQVILPDRVSTSYALTRWYIFETRNQRPAPDSLNSWDRHTLRSTCNRHSCRWLRARVQCDTIMTIINFCLVSEPKIASCTTTRITLLLTKLCF